MAELVDHPELGDLQRYVAVIETERGFDHQGAIEKCLLLGEEVGELFKAVRTHEGLGVDIPGGPIADEVADVLILLCAIANRFEIDIEAAFRSKELHNETRTWT